MLMTESGSSDNRSTRRDFLGKAAALTALAGSSTLAAVGCAHLGTESSRHMARAPIDAGGTILFQGDSITDAGRDRGREKSPNDAAALGRGYAFLTAATLLAEHPGADLKIYNRGISGNKVFQLADRWDKDCIALKPDLVSILIGVNDIWHGLNGQYDGTVQVYERDYLALLQRTRQELPQVRIVVCEPFVLRCGAVNDKWFPEFDRYRAAAKRVADTFEAVFVPFQSMFDEAVKKAPPNYWAGDGVHPTIAGAALMAQTWLATVARA
jgi:lysophospholipase L1-like esterase